MTVGNYEDLVKHIGHKIKCVRYTRTSPIEVTIECETCYEILYSEFKTCPNCDAEMDKIGMCPNGCNTPAGYTKDYVVIDQTGEKDNL